MALKTNAILYLIKLNKTIIKVHERLFKQSFEVLWILFYLRKNMSEQSKKYQSYLNYVNKKLRNLTKKKYAHVTTRWIITW